MNFLKVILLMSIFTTLFGCGQEKGGSLKKITEIKNQDPNFADLSLNIISKKREGNYTSFIGKGLYKNKIVGIEVLLINDIEPGIVNDQISQNGFNKHGVIIKSIGEQSDEFLAALCELYSMKVSKNFRKHNISATIFSLNSEKVNFNNSTSYYKFKIFLNDESNEDDYAELYINIDLKNQELEIFEKDNEYRKAIIKVFSE